MYAEKPTFNHFSFLFGNTGTQTESLIGTYTVWEKIIESLIKSSNYRRSKSFSNIILT